MKNKYVEDVLTVPDVLTRAVWRTVGFRSSVAAKLRASIDAITDDNENDDDDEEESSKNKDCPELFQETPEEMEK